MSRERRFTLLEVAEITGIEQLTLTTFIERDWISPVEVMELDQEDIARIKLIQELREGFGVNDDAIPLILHLVDQLYYLRSRIAQSDSAQK